MLSQQRIRDVLGEQVMRVGERVPGYRKDLVEALRDVLMAQNEGHSEHGRRARVKQIIEALGGKVLDQRQGE